MTIPVPAIRWPANPSRPWVRARILTVLAMGRCLLLGKASAGPVRDAVEGEMWGHYDARGRLDRCDSAGDLAAVVLARHTTEEIRDAVAWACRHEIEAFHHEQREHDANALVDHARFRPSLY
jgi:hypothetical protein